MKVNQANRQSAFTLVEVMIVVGIIALLAALAFPNFVKARGISQKNACVHTLKQIDGMKSSWALEMLKVGTDTPAWSDLVGPDKYFPQQPSCTRGGVYTLGMVDNPPTCSLGVSDGHTLPY